MINIFENLINHVIHMDEEGNIKITKMFILDDEDQKESDVEINSYKTISNNRGKCKKIEFDDSKDSSNEIEKDNNIKSDSIKIDSILSKSMVNDTKLCINNSNNVENSNSSPKDNDKLPTLNTKNQIKSNNFYENFKKRMIQNQIKSQLNLESNKNLKDNETHNKKFSDEGDYKIDISGSIGNNNSNQNNLLYLLNNKINVHNKIHEIILQSKSISNYFNSTIVEGYKKELPKTPDFVYITPMQNPFPINPNDPSNLITRFTTRQNVKNLNKDKSNEIFQNNTTIENSTLNGLKQDLKYNFQENVTSTGNSEDNKDNIKENRNFLVADYFPSPYPVNQGNINDFSIYQPYNYNSLPYANFINPFLQPYFNQSIPFINSLYPYPAMNFLNYGMNPFYYSMNNPNNFIPNPNIQNYHTENNNIDKNTPKCFPKVIDNMEKVKSDILNKLSSLNNPIELEILNLLIDGKWHRENELIRVVKKIRICGSVGLGLILNKLNKSVNYQLIVRSNPNITDEPYFKINDEILDIIQNLKTKFNRCNQKN